MNSIKIELIIPVFSGCLGALALCALLALRLPGLSAPSAEAAVEETPAAEESSLFFTAPPEQSRDLARELYGMPELRDWVIDFFAEICGSREIAEVILANAEAFDIAPALAFALSWEESRFNPQAVNRKNRDESIDRGLFQLNSQSFPGLDIPSFFNPAVNARYGMSHLRHCLNTGGTEISALAMYNAGSGRVKSLGAPKVTLDYVNRILENRHKIEEHLSARLRQEAETTIAAAPPARPRLVRLAPLAGR